MRGLLCVRGAFWRWTILLLLASALRPPPAYNPAPQLLGDALAAAGPAAALLPLWCLSPRAQRVRPAALHRALVFSLCAWLLLIAPIRFAKRALRALLGLRVDPSGHIFLFGVQLVPLWVAQREGGGGCGDGGGTSGCALRLGLAAAEVLLCASSVVTAAFHHAPAEVLAAWACVAALQWVVEGGAPAPSRRDVAAAAGVWAASCGALLALLAAHGAMPPAPRTAARLAYDVGVAGAAMLLA